MPSWSRWPNPPFVAKVPDGVDLRHAAAATEGGHYALSSIRRAGVQPGNRVLVHGATGAIGSAAVQLLVDQGVEVIATAPTAHVELVRGLGAHRVVDFQAEDFTRIDETVDVVLDLVGKSTFGACRPLLAPDGVYVSSDLGPFAQNVALPLVTRLGRGRRVVFPFPSTSPELLEHLRSRLESGAFTPLLDPATYPLDDIVEAYRYVETGQKLGNVVITVTATHAGCRAPGLGPRWPPGTPHPPTPEAGPGARRQGQVRVLPGCGQAGVR